MHRERLLAYQYHAQQTHSNDTETKIHIFHMHKNTRNFDIIVGAHVVDTNNKHIMHKDKHELHFLLTSYTYIYNQYDPWFHIPRCLLDF